MTNKLRNRFAAAALTGAATIALACGGAAAAHADVAPPATSSADVSFVVPVTHDPASTGIEVDGHVNDVFPTDNLKDFTISITCADGLPVTPVSFTATASAYSRLSEAFSTKIALSEQGKVCTVHSTAPSMYRQLNFDNMVGAKPDDHEGARLYISGNVIMRVLTRGGQY
jgi:hypothetical protein